MPTSSTLPDADPPAELDVLLASVIQLARSLIERFGELLPFAAVLPAVALDGEEPELISPWDADQVVPTREAEEFLIADLRARAAHGAIRAAALVVQTRRPVSVAVRLEHARLPTALIVRTPFTRRRVAGGIRHGAPASEVAVPVLFPGV